MADDFGDEHFVVDEVTSLVNEAIDGILSAASYDHRLINKWTSSVSEEVISALAKLQKPFKYAVVCTILQRNGSGYQTASACFWDKQTDASASVQWQNSTIVVLVTVYGLAV
ncbi:hypothetical protein R5R35_009044 [Gryllus longicercus]|uniref:Dynein light chain n=1 Tax=Gryllus longicercus TaxID=2509291 RepID=A0AAN9Z7X2_9ORTH|nr:Dynein light chain Tctex-type 1 [Gryllus bimaculatus]